MGRRDAGHFGLALRSATPALVTGRFIESMRYGTRLRDPLAIGAALRASRVDPSLAPREE